MYAILIFILFFLCFIVDKNESKGNINFCSICYIFIFVGLKVVDKVHLNLKFIPQLSE